MEAQFHEYLEGFLNTAADDEDENAAPWQDLSDRPEVYLPRSKVVAGFVDENGEDAGRMGSVSVHNSLECKISCSNSKVSYVLDTEDVFHRRAGTGAGGFAGAAGFAGFASGAVIDGCFDDRGSRNGAYFRLDTQPSSSAMQRTNKIDRSASVSVF